MSEQILKALMQLFAIIARPASNQEDRRTIVESFLKKQLNQELVEEYLVIFDGYYNEYQSKQRGEKGIAASSVKVLKICTKINEELKQNQKIIVLFRLFEFAKADNHALSSQELEFILTVAEVFRVPDEEHIRIKEFVVNSFEDMLNSNKILLIDSNKNFKHERVKHLYKESVSGQIRVLNVISAGMYLIRYIGSAEMYINGQIIQENKVYVFNTGSAIRNPQITPIYYSDIVRCFNVDNIKNPISFEVKNIGHNFKNGTIGLHDINFQEHSGHLVGIMGASGAGKTTLLNALNGSTKPTNGSISINGHDIFTEKEKIEGLIGFVSQDDLLIEELSVYQNLYYNAKLCFDNYNKDQIKKLVEQILNNLGLIEIKDIQVGSPLNKKISGGQRKRLNIALELIREPSVLFLDEPTSGLSSRDSENIMDLLKELTLKGKLVFVVIHQPSSDIFKMFDNLIILDTGGYLIYDGAPIDSIIYFKEKIHHANWIESECQRCGNVNPEQIFNIVESNVLDQYGKVTRARKVSPIEWSNYYKKSPTIKEIQVEKTDELPEISFKVPARIKQFFVFCTRDILSKLANTQYLAINFLEAPILAFILSYLIKYFDESAANNLGYTFINNSNLPVYIFMSVIVAIFIGLSVSAEEIIKDKKILKREAFLNLSRSSYLFSKVSVLLIISAIQAFTYVLIGNSIMEIKGMFFQYWLVLFSAWVSSNILGLVISDSFKTVVTIYILIPFLVIPQILLSGVIVKYEKLNPTISSPSDIPIYGEIITARWGYEALAVYQFMENDYKKKFYKYDKIKSIAEYKKNYWLPELKNKIDFGERNLDKTEYHEKIKQDLIVLKNEIRKEMAMNKKLHFNYLDELDFTLLNKKVFDETRSYFTLLNKYYISVFNNANSAKDNIVNTLQKTPEERENYLATKRMFHNEKLTEFVENKGDMTRIVEYNGQLFQKIDPIYMDPTSHFVKAHFYSPRKMIFGKFHQTFWVNIMVIWFMSILFYLILYFSLMKKVLNFGGQVIDSLKDRFEKK